MNLEHLEHGDRIKVTFEATFRQLYSDYVSYHRNGATFKVRREGLTVEVIEPVYVEGEHYIDARGTVWRYENTIVATPWIRMGSGSYYSVFSPARPLRRLVPEAAE